MHLGEPQGRPRVARAMKRASRKADRESRERCSERAAKAKPQVCMSEGAERAVRRSDATERILLSVYGRTTDALASAGDEGRGRLRQASGSRQQALIRRFPNGATRRGSNPAIGG